MIFLRAEKCVVFVGQNARLGCTKCLKAFERLDFSGYNRDNWQLCAVETNCEHCKELLKETTKTSVQKAEAHYGVRYSVLLALAYFDSVKFTVIDPMHNLFLGTGKHIFKVWVELGYLTSAELTLRIG